MYAPVIPLMGAIRPLEIPPALKMPTLLLIINLFGVIYRNKLPKRLLITIRNNVAIDLI